MKRVGLVSFMHESNSFLPVPTTLELFGKVAVLDGPEILQHWQGTHHEIGGILEAAPAFGLEIVPLITADAVPGGSVDESAYEEILGRIVRRLGREQMDGLLLSLHGAMVAEHLDDADGTTAERIRAVVGPEISIVVTLDLHANVSERLLSNVTAATVYRTYPHLDQRERGREAAGILARTLEGTIHPTMAYQKPPMVFSILAQRTSEEPMTGLMQMVEELVTTPGIISASVAAGFPYADVAAMGPTMLVVSDGDPARARDAARLLADYAWSRRDLFCRTGTPIAVAVDEVREATATPVALLDIGDNVGGGGPGDGTLIFQALRDAEVAGVLVVLYDPDAVRACASAGVGQRVDLAVGGKTDRLHGQPVRVKGRLRLLHDGFFEESRARHGGARTNNQGLTAVLETDTRDIVVLTSLRIPPFSLEQILSLGIKPQRQRAIIVKGSIAPRAAYEAVTARFIEVDSPGVTAGDPRRFEYRRRRRPMYPFEAGTPES